MSASARAQVPAPDSPSAPAPDSPSAPAAPDGARAPNQGVQPDEAPAVGPSSPAPASGAVAAPSVAPAPTPALALAAKFTETFRFSGQFRLNAYSEWRSRKQRFGDEDVAGGRLRLRPTFDADVSERVGLHLQFNIGHIHANQTNARFAPNGSEPLEGDGPAFAVRQASIRTKLDPGHLTNETGLLPLSDRFGDTLFSGAWDYNPLATSFTGTWGPLNARLAAGRLQENAESRTKRDNADLLIMDVDAKGFGASVYGLSIGPDNGRLPASTLVNAGVRYGLEAESFKVGTYAMASAFRPRGSTTFASANGLAGAAEATWKFESGTLGLLALYATGGRGFRSGSAGNAFVTPMSLLGHHGYWGYTGRLTIQGPTDTGIDDPINIDGGSYGNQGLGSGLATLQVKATRTLASWWSLYAAAGYFGSAAGEAVGWDTYVQSTFSVDKKLTLDLGLSYALLEAGHFAAEFAPGQRDARAVFSGVSRLQLEW